MRIIVVVSLLLVLSGCSIFSPLDGTQWKPVSYGFDGAPQSPLNGTTSTITFANGHVQGSLGCNLFFGDYVVRGQELSITNISSTVKGCDAPLQQQDEQISAALRSVSTWSLEGDTLRLMYPNGTLRFTRMAQAPNAPLEGTTWNLTTFVSNQTARSLVTGTQITATFDNGRVAGSAGCNSYSGIYTLNNNTLTVGKNIITTKKACAPDSIMQQEQEFLDALAATTGYQIKGSQLTLSYPGGQLMFTAQ